jgi:hypothetical protein
VKASEERELGSMTSSAIQMPRSRREDASNLTQNRRRAETQMSLELNRIGIIVDASFHIHRKLGPGLFESVYHTILARDLARRASSSRAKNIFLSNMTVCGSKTHFSRI